MCILGLNVLTSLRVLLLITCNASRSSGRDLEIFSVMFSSGNTSYSLRVLFGQGGGTRMVFSTEHDVLVPPTSNSSDLGVCSSFSATCAFILFPMLLQRWANTATSKRPCARCDPRVSSGPQPHLSLHLDLLVCSYVQCICSVHCMLPVHIFLAFITAK